MHAELARRIRRGRDHAALIGTAPHDDRLALQRGIEQLFHGYEERVHINVKITFYRVEISLHGRRAVITRGNPARSLADLQRRASRCRIPVTVSTAL